MEITQNPPGTTPLISVQGVTQQYIRKSLLSKPAATIAIRDVDFVVSENSVLGLAGASGSGKSTLARCMLGLEIPARGTVRYRGTDITLFGKYRLLMFRRRAQMVFQEPESTLNPRFTAAAAVAEPLAIAGIADAAGRKEQAMYWMEEVGISASESDRATLEFSGGQRCRLAIARALIGHPELIIFDESFSSLDLPVRVRILELLRKVQAVRSLSYVLISHDLSLLARICTDIAVMYQGRIVERAPARGLLQAPIHAHSKELVRAMPRFEPGWLE